MANPKDSQWTYGLCGCFGDCGECLYGCCCTPCAYGGLTTMAHNDSCCGNCTLMCCCGWCLFGIVQGFLGMSNRSRIKDKYGITEGDCGGGFLEWWCCSCCAVVQERREVKHRQMMEAKNNKAAMAAINSMTAGTVNAPPPAMQAMGSYGQVPPMGSMNNPQMMQQYPNNGYPMQQMGPNGQVYSMGPNGHVPPGAMPPMGSQGKMPPMGSHGQMPPMPSNGSMHQRANSASQMPNPASMGSMGPARPGQAPPPYRPPSNPSVQIPNAQYAPAYDPNAVAPQPNMYPSAAPGSAPYYPPQGKQ